MSESLDIASLLQPGRGFALLEMVRGKVIPAQFGNKTVPDFDVVFVKEMAVVLTPLQNLFVVATLLHSVAELVVFDP